MPQLLRLSGGYGGFLETGKALKCALGLLLPVLFGLCFWALGFSSDLGLELLVFLEPRHQSRSETQGRSGLLYPRVLNSLSPAWSHVASECNMFRKSARLTFTWAWERASHPASHTSMFCYSTLPRKVWVKIIEFSKSSMVNCWNSQCVFLPFSVPLGLHPWKVSRALVLDK